jgi:hypothetical protein
MAIKSLRIMCRMDFPSGTFRLWEGAGPFLDANGDLWAGCSLTKGLDRIEAALNGDPSPLTFALSGTDRRIAELAIEDRRKGEVKGTKTQLLIQACDQYDQPVEEPEVKYTGTIDDLIVQTDTTPAGVISTVIIELVGRTVLRRMMSGQVLSDANQRVRSAAMNPGAPPDRFGERTSGLGDKNRVWPRYS